MFQYRLPARKAFQLNAQSARYMRTLSNSDNPDLRKLLGYAQVHTETEQFLIADRQSCQYSPLVTPRSPQPPPPSPTDPTVATVSTELLPQIPEGLYGNSVAESWLTTNPNADSTPFEMLENPSRCLKRHSAQFGSPSVTVSEVEEIE